ncbi:hypothetical protein Bbelb_316580 [Branchiostoma belcheri]|nr:hypothetical protein Bbelb_316580 [Branchiostoma belcheri]
MTSDPCDKTIFQRQQQKATVVDPYPSPATDSFISFASSVGSVFLLRTLTLPIRQYCQLIIPHVILGVLRHGSSPRQPRLGWYDHRLYRQEVYLEDRHIGVTRAVPSETEEVLISRTYICLHARRRSRLYNKQLRPS